MGIKKNPVVVRNHAKKFYLFLWDFFNFFRKTTEFSVTHLKLICGALRDLVPFAQFKKREKHP